ncbi:hypothetical protein MMC12_001231 [Toensbergia leucococca]|nr:hypothetical protein [Toensbergia leucococca]
MSISGSNSSGSYLNGSSEPLSAIDLDLRNTTVALNYLTAILDDSELQLNDINYSTAFWWGIAVAICIAALCNLIFWITTATRLRAAAKNISFAARPSNKATKFVVTITAIIRTISYPQLAPNFLPSMIKLPSFGIIILLLIYLSFILALQFRNVSIAGDQHWQAIGLRAGWLSIAQLPLLILLAGKNNIIGCLTGVGYERLNILHRWVARCMLLTATMHFAYQSYGWNRLGLMQLEWATDTCAPTGMAAYAILLWMNLSTVAPLRNLHYEFFVVQHILTFFGLVIALMYHLPSTAPRDRIYVWIPIGLYLLDRLTRSIRYGHNNARPALATLTALPDNVTGVRISSHKFKHWTPGAFVLLSIPRFGICQSHPATIVSTPSSHGTNLIFLLRSHKGFTKRISASASASATSANTTIKGPHIALFDGPYGGTRVDFAAFNCAILIAGSTGVTFTLPILLDIASRASTHRLPLRRISFIWAVKTAASTHWISAELASTATAIRNAGIELALNIFITQDGSTLPDPSCLCAADPAHRCCCSTLKSAVPNPATPPHDDIKNPIHHTSPSITAPNQPSETHSGILLHHSGRPNIPRLLTEAVDGADGETGVAVCGPRGLSLCVRAEVAALCARRVWGGRGEYGVFLHEEGFGW